MIADVDPRVLAEAARLRREHGYSPAEAQILAWLISACAERNITLWAAGDIP